jgi:hypothetical protein
MQNITLRRPSLNNPPKLYGLWSLWNIMERFFAENFFLLFDVLNSRERDTRLSFWRLSTNDLKLVETVLRFESSCKRLGLNASAAQISEIKFYQEQGGLTVGKFRDMCVDLHRRLQHELEDRVFFALSPEEAHEYWKKKDILSPEVSAKYPAELLDDFEEAGNCMATGRYTASVFHLMRVMETAVKRLAQRHQVTLPDDLHWGGILSAIKPAIEGMPKSSDAERQLRNQHSEVFSLLYHVKQAWRNDTMHPKRTYTANQAKEIFAACKSYLVTLSDVL